MSVTAVRTSASRLLEGHDEPTEGLSLWRAPLSVRCYEAGGAGHGYAACIEESLGRRGLMDLLAAIAPYKGRGLDDFSGVLDDWYLHDRALAGGASEKLLQEHLQSLRDDFLEFGRHRQLFIDILEDRSEKVRLMPVMCWRTSPDGSRRWVFELEADVEGTLRPEMGITEEATIAMSSLAGFLSVFYFLPGLRDGWPEWKPLVEGTKSNYMGPAQVPVLALLHKTRALNNPFVERCERLIDGNVAS